MRPLSLTIEGLTSFRTTQTVDLTDLDLFVITGPTGSGKSSVLDAITLALFGNVARIGSHGLRDLISHGSSYMRVCLDFQAGGTHYRVARRLGRDSHQATLERLEDGSSVVEVDRGGIRAVNERLEQIVGLDFKAFTKAVLLPQGEFDEFLKGDVSERRRILVRLLDLGRYDAAGQAARRQAARLDAIVGERIALIESNYADATQQRQQELGVALDSACRRHAKLKQLKKDTKLLTDKADEAEQSRATLREGIAQIEDSIIELTRLSEAWPELEAEQQAKQNELGRAEEALAKTHQALVKAQTHLQATTKQTGDAALLAKLEAAATAYVREQAELEKLGSQLAEARSLATQLAEANKRAGAAELEAKTALKTQVALGEQAETRQQLAQIIVSCADAGARLAALDDELTLARQKAAAAATAWS